MLAFPSSARSLFPKFKHITTPSAVQDLLDTLRINFEHHGETCRSPLMTLKAKEAHCMEGALLAAAIFWFHGERPLLLDLKTKSHDESHVVALFRSQGLWGAVSKTNHAVLRYRDPIFKTPRELALSYFNEYFLDTGEKTLLSFSSPFDLRSCGTSWLTDQKDVWHIDQSLDRVSHHSIAPPPVLKKLRKADSIEIKTGKITEWKKK